MFLDAPVAPRHYVVLGCHFDFGHWLIHTYKRILERKKKLINRQEVSLSSIQKLQSDLVAISPLTERDWLEEKIEELAHTIKKI